MELHIYILRHQYLRQSFCLLFHVVFHLVGVGPCHSNGVEQVFQAVRHWPQAQGHFAAHQGVPVVKQVHVAPGQRAVLLQNTQTHASHVQHSPLR